MPPVTPFQDIEGDIFYLDKNFEVYSYVLVLVDRFSNFIWAKPLKTKTSNEVATKISEYIMFFGLSGKSTLNFDNGTEFAGITQTMAETLSVNISTNSAYNPTANGLAEVSNRKIKKALSMLIFENSDFENHLTLVVSKLNHMPNDNFNGLSPFEIIFNRPSPLLIAQEIGNHENLVGEIGYILSLIHI